MSTPRTELLAPAGDWDALRAAVRAGADAVYLGLSDFNARKRAANFTPDELPAVMDHLHDRRVRGYVTLNTLVFDGELEAVAKMLATVAQAGADAVIVQDLGVAALARHLAPTLPVHASTQMTVTDAGSAALAAALGVRRVILARELSLAQICQVASASPVPVEVFVHGALCISYSGQCLASLSLGGRSANRGECAQACRLPYRLVVDGREHDAGGRMYLLSPRDLAAYDYVRPLVDAGVAALKIEGRMKGARYVAAATGFYRRALDAALAGRDWAPAADERRELELGFSRTFTQAYLAGRPRGELVDGRSPTHRGVPAGTVSEKTARGLVIAPSDGATLKAGDGVVLAAGEAREDEQGGRVLSVRALPDGSVLASFRREDIDLAKVALGSTVWKTDDPDQHQTAGVPARDDIARRTRVDFAVAAEVGEPLRLTARDEDGHTAEAVSDAPLTAARERPLTIELLREQLGRLGNTPFVLRAIDWTPGAPVLAPKSMLNALRRAVVDQLLAARRAATRHAVAELQALTALREATRLFAAAPLPRRLVLVREEAQFDAVRAWVRRTGAPDVGVYLDLFADGRYAELLAAGRAAGLPMGVATPRIMRPGDEEALDRLAALKPDLVLVRNLAALARLRGHGLTLIADFSLNAVNELAAVVLADWGAARVTPGADAGPRELAALLARFPAAAIEVVVHQHVPMFHTEHCLHREIDQARRGSCHRLCDAHAIELLDRKGVRHPVRRDAFCRSTIFHGQTKSMWREVDRLRALGVRSFRVELLDEDERETERVLEKMRE